MTNKFLTIEQISEFVDMRIAYLREEMRVRVKTLPPEKRELMRRRMYGRIEELKHLRDAISRQSIKENSHFGLVKRVGMHPRKADKNGGIV